ncbi:MAG: precorrin-6y C5,15-methyltransferase (decarboxylating) subunit CbiE [Candidatus Mycalebacterium zealandia]|nr:MAG: precorrin-6y C5,15-methyltransferase (decarboxylating) subunit CbiE [Candidatus Mycalebacterium zealandia]
MSKTPPASAEPELTAIGITCEGGRFALPEKAAEVVRRASVFSGGKRHFEKVRDLLPEGARWIDIGGDIEKTLRAYDRHLDTGGGTIVIFASGDPLFYGIGSTIKKLRPERKLKVFRAPNSIETLLSKAETVCENIAFASVHGRDWHELDAALIAGGKFTGLLTDAVNSPDSAAQRMIEYGFENYGSVTGENLGEKDEKIRSLTLKETAQSDFRQPCAVIIEKIAEPERKEKQFETLPDRPGMITKQPARTRAVERLEVENLEHLWDIGFCTGSVSIEARRRNPRVRVTAFEKNPLCEKLIEKNSKNFSAPGIKVVMGDFFKSSPEKLPAPDSVFIGGHGGRLGEMMEILGKITRPGGKIVLNSVTEESGKTFRARAVESGFKFEARETAGNIEILSAVKK